MGKNKKGQSTLEYIILVTAVIVVIIAFLNTAESPFRVALNGSLQESAQYVNNMSTRFGASMNNIGGN